MPELLVGLQRPVVITLVCLFQGGFIVREVIIGDLVLVVIINEVVFLTKLLKVWILSDLDALGYIPAMTCLRLGAQHGVVELVSIDSFMGRYIILAFPTLQVDGSSNTPQQFSPIGILAG